MEEVESILNKPQQKALFNNGWKREFIGNKADVIYNYRLELYCRRRKLSEVPLTKKGDLSSKMGSEPKVPQTLINKGQTVDSKQMVSFSPNGIPGGVNETKMYLPPPVIPE